MLLPVGSDFNFNFRVCIYLFVVIENMRLSRNHIPSLQYVNRAGVTSVQCMCIMSAPACIASPRAPDAKPTVQAPATPNCLARDWLRLVVWLTVCIEVSGCGGERPPNVPMSRRATRFWRLHRVHSSVFTHRLRAIVHTACGDNQYGCVYVTLKAGDKFEHTCAR